MKHCITMVPCILLLALLSASKADEPAQLTDAQKTKIALIQTEIRAQIRQLEELERMLIAAVRDEKLESQDAPESAAAPLAGPGLVGIARVAGRETDILFLYAHGKVLNPEQVRSRIDGDFVLTLTGRLEVPRDMVVNVWHAGGGVNGDVNTLFVDDRRVSSVGDDRSKHAIDKLKLETGQHTHRTFWFAGEDRKLIGIPMRGTA